MKPEQAFWKLVKPHLPGHFERIENIAGVGIPDVNLCLKGRDYWIELKVDEKVPIVPARFLGGAIDLSTWKRLNPLQRLWHIKRTAQGGAVLLLIRAGDCVYLLQKTKDPYPYYTQLLKLTKPWNWQQLTEIF